MRVSYLLFTMLFLSASVHSQGIEYGGLVSLNFSGSVVRDPPLSVNGARLIPGFEIGGFLDLPLAGKHLSLRPNLIYSLQRSSEVVQDNRTDIQFSYIKVPLDLVYHADWTEKRFSFGFGPYIAYNLGGKYNWSINEALFLTRANTLINFGNNYEKIDAGADLLASYRLNRLIRFNASLDYGFVNMAKQDPDGQGSGRIHTLDFAISVAYVFGGK